MRAAGRLVSAVICALVLMQALACSPTGSKRGPTATVPAPGRAVVGAQLLGVNFNDPIHPTPHDQPIILAAAKNEITSFALQISDLPARARDGWIVRLQPPHLASTADAIPLASFSAAQIVPMPVDLNRAGFVRHTGLTISDRPLPRALLPVAIENGTIAVDNLRDPADPLNPASHIHSGGEPALLWFDLHVPAQTPPGEYTCSAELLATPGGKPAASVPIRITVHDFAIPDERHLLMVSRLDWEDLKRLYPSEFETVAPRLMNRKDDQYAAAVRTLDALLRLAQAHRTQIVIPRLQPTAKWQLGRPRIDWDDLDSVLEPWLTGAAFSDSIPIAYWPMPAVDFLDRFDRASQLDYWSQAAAHFDQKNWLSRAAVWIEGVNAARPASEARDLSAQASELLNLHPRLRVTVPLEDDQIQLAAAERDGLIAPKSTTRLMTAGPGIIFAAPLKDWPPNVARPKHWLRTDLPGLVPYVGAGGDERDVRVWSWLAFLRQEEMILWGSALPRTDSATQPADPDDLVWFYPGKWFGVDEPVPTIQLKWLRRAQQDYEYLYLARQRGDLTNVNALLLARLLAKSVQIQPGQTPDPTYALLCGTADANAWSDAQRLLARLILSRAPGKPRDKSAESALEIEMLRWCEPLEHPMMLAHAVQWQIDRPPKKGAPPGQWLTARVAVDLYNASDKPPAENLLQWTALPRGWEVRPQALGIPTLAPYQVQRYAMDGRYNLAAASAAIDLKSRQLARATEAEITFTHGYTRRETKMKLVLPVASSDRHPPGLKIDGQLDDWSDADAIQAGPMVRMFDRPSLQKQEIVYSRTSSTVFTGWADENFYVSFKLAGMSSASLRESRNFVDYQFRRAWGEDLCEILIQPLFADNTLGPVLHVVCKPTGHWIERKLDGRDAKTAWQPVEGTGIRYYARLANNAAGEWRGEVAIPWKAILDESKSTTNPPAIPPFLRFNFVQHIHATGESASWAGPIDHGRGDAFMGLLYLREPNDPGMVKGRNRMD